MELLAPAGNYEALVAAVKSGANAVYIGGSNFSARQNAKNFDEDVMREAVKYCHLRNVKVYCAVNTLVNDREFNELSKYIVLLCEIGIDGIIVQDLGVARLAGLIAPGLPLHASTQMTVYDINGVRVLEKLGFKRVVLSRELTMNQISDICRQTDIEVEVFVHGAICVSYSGQCLMSSMIGGRSANRGTCAQPCRLQYQMNDKKGFLLSTKDMCLVKHLHKLSDIGVKSLKIEGRMKGEGYVSTVVSVYRKYLDTGLNVSKDDFEKLNRVFYRGGLTDGYFTGNIGKDMFCHTKPDNPYEKQENSEIIQSDEYKRNVSIYCEVKKDKPMLLKIICDDIMVEQVGNIPSEIAVNKPITADRITQQLSKLGGTVFNANEINVSLDDGIILPISEINNVRRNALEKLENAILDKNKVECHNIFKEPIKDNIPQAALKIAVEVANIEQLNAVKGYDYLYIPLDLAEKLNNFTGEYTVILPRISDDTLEDRLKNLNIKTAVATNLGHMELLNKLGIEIICDFTLNIFNTQSAIKFAELGGRKLCLSSELMLGQIRNINSPVPMEVIAYGRLPLMIMENCPVKSTVGCKKANTITDRMGEVFPIKCMENCKCEILNSKPIVMSDKLTDICKSGVHTIRLKFTIESAEACRNILKAYQNGEHIDMDFTRGKFYKGV